MYPAFPALDLEEILKILKTAMLNFRNEQMNKVKSNCFQIFEELIKKKKKRQASRLSLVASRGKIRRQILAQYLACLGMCPLRGWAFLSPGHVQGEARCLSVSGTPWRTFLHWVGGLDQRPTGLLQHCKVERPWALITARPALSSGTY